MYTIIYSKSFIYIIGSLHENLLFAVETYSCQEISYDIRKQKTNCSQRKTVNFLLVKTLITQHAIDLFGLF